MKIWYKVDVLKNVRDEENQYFLKIYLYKVPCVKMLILGKLLGGRYLFEILHSSFTVKISKNAKSEFF